MAAAVPLLDRGRLGARCAGCGVEHFTAAPQTKYGRHDAASRVYVAALTRSLDAAGWTYKRGLRRPRCPACSPATPEETTVTKTPVAQLTPTPPRTPTPADRRRVADALDEFYSIEAGRYRGTGSDQRVAEKLGVPRAWVTDVRELLYGGGGGCEADEATARAATQLTARLAAVETRIEEALAELEAVRAELRTLAPQEKTP